MLAVGGGVTTAEPSYEEMLNRCVSTVQWLAGTRDRAAAAVWRAVIGMGSVAVAGAAVAAGGEVGL